MPQSPSRFRFNPSLSRRRLLQWGTGALAVAGGVAVAPRMTTFAGELNDFVKGPPVPDVAPTQLSEHVWMIYSDEVFPTPRNQGMMANITFVVTDAGVVVIDTGGSLQIGEMAIRMIRTVTDRPVVAIFISHYHGDHWLGNHAFVNAFGTELPIYAHAHSMREIAGVQGNLWRGLMERWTEGATLGTQVVPPNREVAHGNEFQFGEVTLRMHHYGIAHTPSDISVEVVGDGVTYVGDVAMEKRIANMDDGSFVGSMHYFDSLTAAIGHSLWVPGHGMPGHELLLWNRELFAGIYENALAAVEGMESIDHARSLVLDDPRVASKAAETRGFEANIGRYISLAYLEAEQAAF